MPAYRLERIARVLLAVLLTAFAKNAEAQTLPRGEGYVTIAFGDFFAKDHFLSNGDRIDIGHIRTLILTESVELGITDRLSADLSLPIVASRYYGPDPHQLPIDNGNYHGGTQDFTLGVHYNVRKRPFAVTPFLSLTLPSRDYTYYAHSAVGTNQRAVTFGFEAGRQLESWLPNTYFQGTYSYTVVESVTGVRPNRNNMSVEAEHPVGPHLAFRGFADALITHGGFNIPQDFPNMEDLAASVDPRWLHHDQSINANHLNLGGEVSVALGPRWEVFAGLTHTLWGENEHATRLGVSMGITRSFTTPWARRRPLHAQFDKTSHK